MELSVRVDPTGPLQGIISVDGAWGAEGLNLSHWPGNTTPSDLVHELSTGCALRFAELAQTERIERAAGAKAIVNNHFDTDGVLALFATRHPELALEFGSSLLEAAAAGDFFQVPSERGLALDALITNYADPELSPFARTLAGEPDPVRHTEVTVRLLAELPALLDCERLPSEELWLPVVERYRLDRTELEATSRHDDTQRDLTTYLAPQPWKQEGPGRHALFGSTRADRVLALAPSSGGGHLVRLILSTQSWFEPLCDERLARPDLARLAERFNQLEPSPSEDGAAWRAQKLTGASPELWFGTTELEAYAEHSSALRASSIDLDLIRREIETELSPS